jgi:hypothetical protein
MEIQKVMKNTTYVQNILNTKNELTCNLCQNLETQKLLNINKRITYTKT